MDINQPTPVVQPPKPIQWTWIAQRQPSSGQAKSIWKFGFIAPDGAEVRVTFHQVGDVAQQQAAKQQEKQAQLDQQMQMGMMPSPDPTGFAPPGVPTTDITGDASFYVTFFSNRHPEFFMKWDTSLDHDDSMIVWITITHGIIDFIHQAQPANVILDDLANGKMKMVLRSVAMDVAAANPGYELEQTSKHHYRSFYQIKKAGSQSAFNDSVAGTPNEGDTKVPGQTSPVTGGQAQVQAQAVQQSNSGEKEGVAMGSSSPNDGGSMDSVTDDKGQDPTAPQPETDVPAFASAEPVPIKKTASPKRGLTVEIGKDYSIAVKNNMGDAVDRYRARGPMDIIRWITEKGYALNRMMIVDKEQPSNHELAPEAPEKQPKPADQFLNSNDGNTQTENFIVSGNSVCMKQKIDARQAAIMNVIVSAPMVRLAEDGVEFVFDTDRDMSFKKALVELAAQKLTASISTL